MDVVITQKAIGRISGKKLIKLGPDSEHQTPCSMDDD